MEITRNVADTAPADRLALEHVLGQQLRDDQQVVVRVISQNDNEACHSNAGEPFGDDELLPEWCNVFEGLSDEEIAAVERVMLSRADLTRPAE